MNSMYGKLLAQINHINMINPVSMGLRNMERICEILDFPLRNIPVVHIVTKIKMGNSDLP